jgi:pyruvate,orthophosphate dikinase
MFFEGERIKAMREMILASDTKDAKKRWPSCCLISVPTSKGFSRPWKDLGYHSPARPAIARIRPSSASHSKELAHEMGVSIDVVRNKIAELEEFNPMLGHRGCRLGITYPEITAMQTRAIIEAALNLKAKGIQAHPEIMVPLVALLPN